MEKNMKEMMTISLGSTTSANIYLTKQWGQESLKPENHFPICQTAGRYIYTLISYYTMLLSSQRYHMPHKHGRSGNTQQEAECIPSVLFKKILGNSLPRLCNQCGSIVLHGSADRRLNNWIEMATVVWPCHVFIPWQKHKIGFYLEETEVMEDKEWPSGL